MLGYTRTLDWSKVSLYPSSSFLFKNQLAKEGLDSLAPVATVSFPFLGKGRKKGEGDIGRLLVNWSVGSRP